MIKAFKTLFKEETAEYLAQCFPTGRTLINTNEPEIEALKLKKAEKDKLISYVNFSKELLAPPENQVRVKSAQDVFDYLRIMEFYQEERFVILCLDTKNTIIDQVLISKGSVNSTIVHPSQVFSVPIKIQCFSIICIHCHPSGEPEPSNEDLETTKRLVEAGNILGIKVLDHVVIGMEKYVSLKERGLV